jgi:hypothetical protein
MIDSGLGIFHYKQAFKTANLVVIGQLVFLNISRQNNTLPRSDRIKQRLSPVNRTELKTTRDIDGRELMRSTNPHVTDMPQVPFDEIAISRSMGWLNAERLRNFIKPDVDIEREYGNVCEWPGDGSAAKSWAAVAKGPIVLINNYLHFFLAIHDRNHYRRLVTVINDPFASMELLRLPTQFICDHKSINDAHAFKCSQKIHEQCHGRLNTAERSQV